MTKRNFTRPRLSSVRLHAAWMAGIFFCGGFAASAATIPASSYIQKGLVANWDAIENGGAGVHVDVAVNGWTDLVGGCVLTTNVTADGCATTTETSVHLVKTSLRAHDEGGFVTGLANLVGSAEHTIEIAARDTSNGFDQKPWLAIKNADVGEWSNRILQWYNQNGVLAWVLHYNSANNGRFNGGSNPINTDFTRSIKTSDCRNYTSYNNGTYATALDLGESSKTIVSTKGALTLNANYYTEKPWTGSTPDYHAVRIYSRALTADEIKWNRVVDRIRFEGADPAAVLPTGYRISDNAVELHLAAMATRGGSVSVDGAEGVGAWDVWCTPRQEASVTVKAVAAAKYVFTGWTGDVDGLDATAAELTLTDEKPRTLQANFQATESLVEIERFQQRYPWNGLVDIDYFVDGVTAAQAETLWLEFSVTTGTGVAARKVVASNFVKRAWCDLPVTNGSYHIVWDSAADGVTLLATNGTATARLYSRTVAEKDATYAIVDLSAGKSATRYPIRYVDGGEDLSGCFNCDEYLLNKMVLKRVKAGEFWMGVGNVESGTARHRVRLTEDYFCGLFPVSRKQFECLTGASHNQGRADRNPAEALSWNHIHYGYSASEPSALEMLNQKVQVAGGTTLAGLFALPTEAQWEYACRAGTETKWYFGDTKPSDWSTKWAQMTGTTSATLGQREPNPWGFYDFYGNAGEWCEDWYGDYPPFSQVEVTENPTGPATGENRVIRGLPRNTELTSGYRWKFSSTKTTYAELGGGYFGFRVVRPVLTIGGETTESEVTTAERTVAVDLTSAVVRKLLHVSEFLPLVYNTTNTWARGGDPDVAATLAYAQMSGEREADPSTWVVGEGQTLLTAAGEGSYGWTPPIRGLYRVTMTIGEAVSTAYYDLLDTEGVSAGQSIEGFELSLSVDELTITGGPLRPEVTLKDGDKTLVEGDDYTVSCVDNVGVGTATLKVTGIGEYAGEIVRTFRIVDVGPVSKATDEMTAGPVDLRTNRVLRVVKSQQDLLPFAANDSVLWPAGGIGDDTRSYAVISYAPMAAQDAEPDESQRIVLPQTTGEVPQAVRLKGGCWQVKLSFWNWILYDRSYQLWGWRETSTLTRTVYYLNGGLMILVK